MGCHANYMLSSMLNGTSGGVLPCREAENAKLEHGLIVEESFAFSLAVVHLCQRV